MIPGVHSHRKLNGGAPPEWKITSPSLSRDVCSEKNAIDVVAIISTWFDADIIYANVRNCFLQGCSRVLLLDNDSPDESVKIAVSAGAEVAEVYSTEFYDDDLRIYRENEIQFEQLAHMLLICTRLGKTHMSLVIIQQSTLSQGAFGLGRFARRITGSMRQFSMKKSSILPRREEITVPQFLTNL